VLVIVPTYNERENIEPIIERLHSSVPEAHVLVVDDGSPDGTGAIADKLAEADERVHVLHRAAKAGLGAASTGDCRPATRFWSRWTRTARTRRSSCRACSAPRRTPTW
jgi:cellulose synthase/poly-beta-1,6-N-acetylglucosamine synthase-like glycosyltransferase